MPQSLQNYVWVNCRHHIPWRAIACIIHFSDATYFFFHFIGDEYGSLKNPHLSSFNLFSPLYLLIFWAEWALWLVENFRVLQLVFTLRK